LFDLLIDFFLSHFSRSHSVPLARRLSSGYVSPARVFYTQPKLADSSRTRCGIGPYALPQRTQRTAPKKQTASHKMRGRLALGGRWFTKRSALFQPIIKFVFEVAVPPFAELDTPGEFSLGLKIETMRVAKRNAL
jgi:hypothetical protein